TITKDEITLAQALAELKSAKPTTAASTRPKAKGLAIHEEGQATTPIKKDQIRLDEELAFKLQAEEEEEERLAREKFEANVTITKEWNDIQAKIKADQLLAERLQAREQEELTIEERAKLAQQRSIMCTYLKNMAGWKPKDLKRKSFANIQELFDKAFKRVNTFVDFKTELVEGSEVRAEISKTREEISSKRTGDELEQGNTKK
ncbi:hypothetical protein Tco_1427888, partial [Tanacetum coccineum]